MNNVQLTGSGNGNVQNEALNGAQVTAMVSIVKQVAAGEIPRDTGVQMIYQSFPISEAEAESIVGEAGRSFTPSNVSQKEEEIPPQ